MPEGSLGVNEKSSPNKLVLLSRCTRASPRLRLPRSVSTKVWLSPISRLLNRLRMSSAFTGSSATDEWL